jgi:HEPN domain-containing protein
MTNHHEAYVQLRSAEAAWQLAQNNLSQGFPHGAVQQAQLCAEHAAKAVIACFEATEHEHNPSPQLFGIVAENLTDITNRPGEETATRLRRLAIDAQNLAPWHIRATYGQDQPDLPRIAAADLISDADAQWALALAERSFATSRDFVQAWLAAGTAET